MTWTWEVRGWRVSTTEIFTVTRREVTKPTHRDTEKGALEGHVVHLCSCAARDGGPGEGCAARAGKGLRTGL